MESGKPRIVWLQGASDSGCSVSLLNSAEPQILEALQSVTLSFHPTLMPEEGARALEKLKEFEILAVEGAVPEGKFCEIGGIAFEELLRETAKKAKHIISVGSCASYGGVVKAKPNPTRAKSAEEALGKSVLKIPGCPAHPDWVVSTLLALLNGKNPPDIMSKKVHERCNLFYCYDNEIFAKNPGDEGCLKKIGCKGQDTYADCPVRRWNNKTNYCNLAGAPCIGCTQAGFPDSASPFFKETAGILAHPAKLDFEKLKQRMKKDA